MTAATDDPRDYLRARDALGSTAPMAFDGEFPLLGIRLRVRSNARRAIELAADTFAVWGALDAALVDPERVVEMRVIVHDSAPADEAMIGGEPRPFVYRRHGPVLVAASGAALLTINLSQRLYVAFVPHASLDRSEWYAWHVNGMARFAVSALDRQPIHAATFLVDDTAVIVCGPAGAGKSTLAYAALRQGFPLLAEEATHVALAGGPRLWGHADRIALAAASVDLFPELEAWPATLRPSGKVKRSFMTAELQAVPPLTHQGPVVLCALTRERHGGPRVEPLPSSERAALLAAEPEEGFDQFPDVHQRLDAAFSGARACRLSPGADPHAAVAALAEIVRRG